jgi:pSer/pThr/pTyr-binding forkhead associated (FHA) protein
MNNSAERPDADPGPNPVSDVSRGSSGGEANRPFLVILRGGSVVARREVDKHPLSIGREADNDLVLDDRLVSRHHAALVQEAGRWSIRDLGSRSKLRVGGQVCEAHELKDGDQFGIGPFKLLFLESARSVAAQSAFSHGQFGNYAWCIVGPLSASMNGSMTERPVHHGRRNARAGADRPGGNLCAPRAARTHLSVSALQGVVSKKFSRLRISERPNPPERVPERRNGPIRLPAARLLPSCPAGSGRATGPTPAVRPPSAAPVATLPACS